MCRSERIRHPCDESATSGSLSALTGALASNSGNVRVSLEMKVYVLFIGIILLSCTHPATGANQVMMPPGRQFPAIALQ